LVSPIHVHDWWRLRISQMESLAAGIFVNDDPIQPHEFADVRLPGERSRASRPPARPLVIDRSHSSCKPTPSSRTSGSEDWGSGSVSTPSRPRKVGVLDE
jgi:hypothetical protein